MFNAIRELVKSFFKNPSPSDPQLWVVLDGDSTRVFAETYISALSGGLEISPSATLNEAMGLAAGGERACIKVTSDELIEIHADLLRAYNLRLPLVVHVAADDHDSVYAIAQTGVVVLFASDVQELLDLSFAARIIAEKALLPVVLVHDSERSTPQRCKIPSHKRLEDLLGNPTDLVESSSIERVLFGDQRRRVPQRTNLEQPVLVGPLGLPAQAKLGARILDRNLGYLVDDVLALCSKVFERTLSRVKVAGSGELTILLQGGALNQVIENHRGTVIGLTCLRPFPNIKEYIKGELIVLERGLNKSLWRDVLVETGITSRSVVYGLLGMPLSINDIRALSKNDGQDLILGVQESVDGSPRAEARAASAAAGSVEFLKTHGEDPRVGLTLVCSTDLAHKLVSILGSVDLQARGRFLENGVLLAFSAEGEDPGLSTAELLFVDNAGSPLLNYGDKHSEIVITGEKGISETRKQILALSEPEQIAVVIRHLNDSPQIRKIKAAYKAVGASEIQLDELEKAISEDPKSITPYPVTEKGEPLAVKFFTRESTTFESVPSFFHRVGSRLEPKTLVPDPYLALGDIPPLTATFNRLSGAVPHWDQSTCDGCSACLVACPEGACSAVVLSPESVITAFCEHKGIQAIQPLAGKISSRICRDLREADSAPATFKELFDPAMDWLIKAMKPTGDRAVALEAGQKQLSAVLGHPIAVTEKFFAVPERKTKDSGELFFLAINPDSCKGCGACVLVCPNNSLAFGHKQGALAKFNQWSDLPDTKASTIEAQESPLEGTFLSRSCAMAISGGCSADPGSSEKLALRSVLAVAERLHQPKLQAFLRDMKRANDELKAATASHLSSGLPALEELDEALKTKDTAETRLGALLSNSKGVVQPATLRRMRKTSKSLDDLIWRVTKGPDKLGRARFSIVFCGNVRKWAAKFPDNAFHAPALAAGVATAKGLAEAQTRSFARDLALVQEAQLLVSNPRQAPMTMDQMSLLEKALIPPVILVTDESSLLGKGLSELMVLLNSDYQVKIIILGDGSLSGAELLMLGLSNGKVPVSQCSLAAGKAFYKGLQVVFSYLGPGVVRVYTPKLQDQSSAIEQASKALNSRTWPVFTFDPMISGVFGTRISLEGNPINNETSPVWSILQELSGVETPFTNRVKDEVQRDLNAKHQKELASLKAEFNLELEKQRTQIEEEITKRVSDGLLSIAGYEA